MKFLLSGEGPTDIGDWGNSVEQGRFFRPGPMALFIDTIANERLGYSPLEVDAGREDTVMFIDKHTLIELHRTDPVVLRGKKAGKDTAYFTRNAQTLGIKAKEKAAQENDSVIAVLFHDSDGTQSRDEWGEKRKSIARGFAMVGFDRGVPMVPRPKSEAWLLAALDNNGHPCFELEERSGNDGSPHCLKSELAARLEDEPNRELLVDLIHDGVIDQTRIQLPSYLAFKETLEESITRA